MKKITNFLYVLTLLVIPVLTAQNIQNLIDTDQIKGCLLANGELHLENKGLQTIDGLENVPGIENLRELHITNNKINILDLQKLSKFEMLYVINAGFNEIESVKPITDGKLEHLEILFLNNNKLSSLQAGTFDACPSLQALYLHDNDIALLQNNCLRRLNKLRLLYLQNNLITNLPSNIFCDLNKLHVLYLKDNPLQTIEAGWCRGLESLKNMDLLDETLNHIDMQNIITQCFTENNPQNWVRENITPQIETFLSVVRKEVYQDILVDGKIIKEGVKDCEIRYPNIKKILDQYNRPVTVLDIGASEGYFSLRIAAEYDSSCVMIEGDSTLLLPKICGLNKQLDNLIVLEKFITPQDLKELGECEHFDLVLAFNVIHQMKDKWKESIDYLLTLGDNILIETPPPGCHTAANKDLLPLIEEYLSKNKNGRVIGQVPRYGRPGLPGSDQKYSNVYLLQMNKNVLHKPTWGSPNVRFYAVNSNLAEKTLYKPRINKTIEWKKGINLWTFKHMNGVYPVKEVIHQEIQRLSTFVHGDFMPWNMIIQGNNLELIDWEDNNLPANIHNFDACLAHYEDPRE